MCWTSLLKSHDSAEERKCGIRRMTLQQPVSDYGQNEFSVAQRVLTVLKFLVTFLAAENPPSWPTNFLLSSVIRE